MENFELNSNKNYARIKISKEIYDKEVIIHATYVLLDKYYFLVDVDNKENNFIIHMWAKKENSLSKKDVLSFFDELIETNSYLKQLENTKDLREILLERALLTQKIDEE
jgi:His-Xaa-Ser system protein HxsD